MLDLTDRAKHWAYVQVSGVTNQLLKAHEDLTETSYRKYRIVLRLGKSFHSYQIRFTFPR